VGRVVAWVSGSNTSELTVVALDQLAASVEVNHGTTATNLLRLLDGAGKSAPRKPTW
jgi:hypothetical protein